MKNSNKGFINAVLIIVIVLILGAAGAYFVSKKNTSPTYSPTPTLGSGEGLSDGKQGWKVYKNTKYGFNISFPEQLDTQFKLTEWSGNSQKVTTYPLYVPQAALEKDSGIQHLSIIIASPHPQSGYISEEPSQRSGDVSNLEDISIGGVQGKFWVELIGSTDGIYSIKAAAPERNGHRLMVMFGQVTAKEIPQYSVLLKEIVSTISFQ